MKIRSHLVSLLSILLLAACGGGDTSESPEASASGGQDASEAQASVSWPAEPTGPVDEELAERGEDLFQSSGCVACHRIGGGRLVGPDLAGVTERRSYDWTMAMITNPDSMLRRDSIAQALLEEYFTPMSNQGVTAEEARALWEYLRHESEESDE